MFPIPRKLKALMPRSGATPAMPRKDEPAEGV